MTESSGSAVLVTEPSPGIRLLTLNRPAVRNAMTEEMTVAWDAAVDRVAADRDTRVLVVTGEGSSFAPAPISPGWTRGRRRTSRSTGSAIGCCRSTGAG